eukprot:10455057-Lingulodinium_polyedra.AAC.1
MEFARGRQEQNGCLRGLFFGNGRRRRLLCGLGGPLCHREGPRRPMVVLREGPLQNVAVAAHPLDAPRN